MKIITKSENLNDYIGRQSAPFEIKHYGNGVVEVTTPIPTVDSIFLEILSILKGLNKHLFVTSYSFKSDILIRHVPEQLRTKWNEEFEISEKVTKLYINFEEKW